MQEYIITKCEKNIGEKAMLKIDIQGWKIIELENLVLDFNGTIAVDGVIVPPVIPILQELSGKLTIYIISADTFGTVEEQCKDLPVKFKILAPEDQQRQKGQFIRELGGDRTCSIGNGEVDVEMLRESALSICVMGYEACSTGALLNSHLLVSTSEKALELLLNPDRIKATLRR